MWYCHRNHNYAVMLNNSLIIWGEKFNNSFFDALGNVPFDVNYILCSWSIVLYFVGENFTVWSFGDFCVIAMFGCHLPYREAPCLQSGFDPRIKDPSSRSPALGRGQDMLDKSLNVFLWISKYIYLNCEMYFIKGSVNSPPESSQEVTRLMQDRFIR